MTVSFILFIRRSGDSQSQFLKFNYFQKLLHSSFENNSIAIFNVFKYHMEFECLIQKIIIESEYIKF